MARGAGQQDTALATLVQALVVEVRGDDGAPGRGEPVRFEALPHDTIPFLNSVSIAGVLSPSYDVFFADTADARGLAAVLVRLGRGAGTGRVRITVPRLGIADTATYTITPASAATVRAFPADTTLYVGRSYVLRGRVLDAYGNARTDPVSFVALGASATVDASGRVTGAGIGRGKIVVSAGCPADTGGVSVVPQARIAAKDEGPGASLVLIDLDGSARQPLGATTFAQYPSWNPSGTLLAYEQLDNAFLYTIDLAGTIRRVVQPGDSNLVQEAFPQYSRDGSYIYFAGVVGDVQLWRVRPDGTELERVSPPGPPDTYPSPSPDGGRVAFATTRFGPGSLGLGVLVLATDSIRPLGVGGAWPRWAPTGETICYIGDDGAVRLIQSDGSNDRRLSVVGRSYQGPLDWSPDGRWIVVRSSATLDLIEVATGLTLPLGYSGALYAPAWKP